MRKLGLTDYFSTIVYGDDLPTHKPEPEGLREIMRRLKVDAVGTLMVGDADVDVLGAAACGVDTLLIDHGRAIPPAITAKSWRSVALPAEAYAVLERCVG